MNSGTGSGKVLASLLVALLLAVYPMPYALLSLRPEWAAMAVIYWAIVWPWRVTVGMAWAFGLILDAFQGVTLGQNALGLAVLAYLCQSLHQRLRHYAVVQQACVVFVLVGLHLLLGHWVQGFAQGSSDNLMFLTTASMSALTWPLFTFFMRTSFKVSPARGAKMRIGVQ